MDIGKQIKIYRLRANLTQERLAEAVHVTPQAVSKWELGQTLPDIALLPELTSVLGVRIDDLFDSPEETHLRRIEAMAERETMLSRADFDYAVARLGEIMPAPEMKGRCLTLLAQLHMQRSDGYAALAADYARQALEIEPEKKDNHSTFFSAMHGVLPDWCCSNRSELIEYYQNFVQAHPDYMPGYLWLLDALLPDRRLREARETLEAMKKRFNCYQILLYEGWTRYYEGRFDEAERVWRTMTETYADNWFAWSSRGDAYAHRAMYDEAIEMYREAIRLQERPRFTDNESSIAQLCRLKGDWKGAMEAYARVIGILREDWNLTDGEDVRRCKENIEACRRALERAQT